MTDQQAKVDDHAYADEEVWNEQGIAYELETRHQGTGLGDEAVHYQASKEGSEQSVEPHHLGKRGAKEHERQDEDVLHDAVLIATQEPAADAGKGKDDEDDIERTAQAEEHPRQPRRIGALTAHQNGQDKQGCKQGKGCCHDADDHDTVTAETVAPHYGIGDERMAGIDAGQQDTGRKLVVQEPDTRGDAHHEGDGKGEHPEAQSVAPILLHAAHLQLQAGQEHDVVDADLPEELEGTVVRQQVQPVLPHQHACHDEPYDGRNAQLPQQQRRKQDDAQHHREDPSRVRDEGCRRCCMEGAEKYHLLHY